MMMLLMMMMMMMMMTFWWWFCCSCCWRWWWRWWRFWWWWKLWRFWWWWRRWRFRWWWLLWWCMIIMMIIVLMIMLMRMIVKVKGVFFHLYFLFYSFNEYLKRIHCSINHCFPSSYWSLSYLHCFYLCTINWSLSVLHKVGRDSDDASYLIFMIIHIIMNMFFKYISTNIYCYIQINIIAVIYTYKLYYSCGFTALYM